MNLEYDRIRHRIKRARMDGDAERVKELEQQRRKLPSLNVQDPKFRRLQYIRYADDVRRRETAQEETEGGSTSERYVVKRPPYPDLVTGWGV